VTVKNNVFFMWRRVAHVRTDVSEECISWIVFLLIVLRLIVTANVLSSSPILVNLMMKAMCSSETPVNTRATGRNIQEDGIIHGLAGRGFEF
jgi:hypothetical protein